MPELPEVDALAAFLDERLRGRVITDVELGSIAVLKTYDPAPDALIGAPIETVQRHGKFVDVDVDGLHLVFHLARAGWLRWYEEVPATRVRPGKSPIALRVRLDEESGFDLTEAGTRKGLAVYVVRAAAEVAGIASLGPDPLAAEFTGEVFAEILRKRRQQIKGVLRDQSIIAGIGNAYSDEILHAAQLSPFAIAADLPAERVEQVYTALREVLQRAVRSASGKPAAQLKDAKRAGMAVHGRAGQACPECGDVVREVSFADSALQYCASCQTGGKPLADRRMSRLLR